MNRNKIISLICAGCLALSLTLVSCSKNSSVLTLDNQAKIYASVIKRLYHDYGDGYGGPTTAYIMKYTDDSGSLPGVEPNSVILLEALQKAVITELNDTRRTYIWVNQASEIPVDAVFGGGGCQVILGNIHLQKDNSVQVTASLFFGGTGGGGTTFIVEMTNNTWTVTGKTGPEWIS
jgi:hypothetical protein